MASFLIKQWINFYNIVLSQAEEQLYLYLYVLGVNFRALFLVRLAD
jgi:hypothetical protein